jgi:hypothetical protein
MLRADCPLAQDLHAFHAALDLAHQGPHPGLVLMRSQVLPARNRRELEPVEGREARIRIRLATLPGTVLSRTIDPDAFGALARKQGLGGTGARPVLWRGDEALLATLLQQVAQRMDLCLRFIADLDITVGPRPDGSLPLVEVSDLLGDLVVAPERVPERRG